MMLKLFLPNLEGTAEAVDWNAQECAFYLRQAAPDNWENYGFGGMQ